MDLSEIEYFLASVECKHCSGMGNFPHMMDWQSCPDCHGSGYVMQRITPEEMATILMPLLIERLRILATKTRQNYSPRAL